MTVRGVTGVVTTRCRRSVVLVLCLTVLLAALGSTVEAAGAASHDHVGENGVVKDPAEFRSDLAIFTLIVFVALLLLLRKFAWTPIMTALDDRESRVRDDLAATESARKRAELLVSEHEAKMAAVQNEVKEILAEARRDADHTRQEAMTKAQEEAEAIKNRSIQEIEMARDHALQELFSAVSDRVVTATEQVLGRALTDDDRDRLVEDALSQFSASSDG